MFHMHGQTIYLAASHYYQRPEPCSINKRINKQQLDALHIAVTKCKWVITYDTTLL